MNINSNRVRVQLDRSQMLKVNDGKHCRALCHSGRIWITFEDDTRDVILETNTSFIIDRAGSTLITALQPAEITLEGPDRRPWNAAPSQPGRPKFKRVFSFGQG